MADNDPKELPTLRRRLDSEGAFVPGRRLHWGEIKSLIRGRPDEACDLALELRDSLLEIAPELAETIAFKRCVATGPTGPTVLSAATYV